MSTEYTSETQQIKRDTKLESLLTELKKQDPLFERNVPAQSREEFDDERLLDHLRTTYTKEEFIIREESEVLKYAQADDKVIAKKIIQYEPAIIKAYERCIVKSVSKDKKTAHIETTEKTDKFKTSVSIDKLTLLGTNYLFKGYFYIDNGGKIGMGTRPLSDVEIGKENLKKGIRCKSSIEKGDYVVFTEDNYFGNIHIPEGNVGYILGRTTELFNIYWIKQKGLQNETAFYSDNRTYYCRYLFYPKDVIVVKKNFIEFDELYKKNYHPPEE